MSKEIIEEIKRIHSLTYGSDKILEEDFIDRVLRKVGLRKDKGEKIDDPKKADLVSDDVREFYNTLQQAADSGGLSQQKKGSINYQKSVESMQIGLMILGYDLPRYGVDGLFGSETAAAVDKFTKEKLGNVVSEAKLLDRYDKIVGYPGQGTHNASDWASRNAWDVTGNVGDKVYSISSGVVNKVRKGSGGLLRIGKKKIYGDQISINSNDGKPNVFYTHLDTNLKAGDSVKEGDVIGTLISMGGIPTHVHIGLESGNLSTYVPDLSKATGGSSSSSSSEKMSQATPAMLNKLIELLKVKNIKSEDIKKYIDKYKVDVQGITDQSFYKKLLENLGAPVTDENLTFLYAWRQAEGKAGKYNPFNTTQGMPGATNYNSVGVKNYLTIEDGMVATVKTLKNGRYNCIVDGLKNNIGATQIASCPSLETWGTGSLVLKVLNGYASGGKPKPKELA